MTAIFCISIAMVFIAAVIRVLMHFVDNLNERRNHAETQSGLETVVNILTMAMIALCIIWYVCSFYL